MTPAIPRSEQVEAWLTSRGVKFAPARWLPLDKIKHSESRHNQARAEALDPEVVDRYVVGVKTGDAFPPIVVYKSGAGYMIVDGNHRDESHVRANASQIAAYILADDTPTDLIEILTIEANTKHGQPTNTAWRIKQAIHLIATGTSAEVATAATGVTQSQITTARRQAKADERARRLGVTGWDTVTPTNRMHLAGVTSDPVFYEAACTVIDTTMASMDLQAFIRQIKAAVSEADALRIVGEVADQRKARMGIKSTAGRHHRLHNPRQRFVTALGALMALEPKDITRAFVTDEERKEIANRCSAAAVTLMEMEEVLDHALRA